MKIEELEALFEKPIKRGTEPEGHPKDPRTPLSSGAVKIRSDLLGEDIWLVFGDFQIDDGLVCYFPEEIEYLKGLPPDEVKRIFKVKKVFPHGRILN